MSDRFQQCEELFHAAAALPGPERAEFPGKGLRHDPDCGSRWSDFSPPMPAPVTSSRAPRLLGPWIGYPPRKPGRGGGSAPIGSSSEIGRGGMGAVYLAERADGQYEQRVALKLIKRGMDTEQVLARFRSERQILASLDHPNIARLLDGGSTDEGVPFFAMEYIEGEPIDAYVERQGLSVEDRIQLFSTCAAPSPTRTSTW